MTVLARLVINHRRWVLLAWLLLAVAGGYAAPRATSALSYDFGLPGQHGYEANQQIVRTVRLRRRQRPGPAGRQRRERPVTAASGGRGVPTPLARPRPAPGSVSFADHRRCSPRTDGSEWWSSIRSRSRGRTPTPPRCPPSKRSRRRRRRPGGPSVTVTGEDALATGGGGGADVLVETLFGGIGALVVLVLVFGSLLAIMPLVVAAASILTTFLIVWGLTGVTDVSFIVQYLLALIGLGVAIDYALLIVTRWREERGRRRDNAEAVRAGAGHRRPLGAVLRRDRRGQPGRADRAAGAVPAQRRLHRSAHPDHQRRRRAHPAAGAAAGGRPATGLAAPAQPATPRAGCGTQSAAAVVRHRWTASVASLWCCSPWPPRCSACAWARRPTIRSPPPAAPAASRDHPGRAQRPRRRADPADGDPDRRPGAGRAAVQAIHGVAGAVAPRPGRAAERPIVDVWTARRRLQPGRYDRGRGRSAAPPRRPAPGSAASRPRTPTSSPPSTATPGGSCSIIIAVTFLLLARALRSVVLPIKALVLNVMSLGAAYGVTVLIWQHGVGAAPAVRPDAVRRRSPCGCPIAVFAFLFGLSMDYEVFLLSRIREEHDAGHGTDEATGQRRGPHRPAGHLRRAHPVPRLRRAVAGARPPTSRSWRPRSRWASSSTPPSCAASSPRRWSPRWAAPTGGCPPGESGTVMRPDNVRDPRPRTRSGADKGVPTGDLAACPAVSAPSLPRVASAGPPHSSW